MDGVFELLAALVARCAERGSAFPLTIDVAFADGSHFGLCITGGDDDVGMRLIRDEGTTQAPLPVWIYVTDAAGESIHGHITADDPETLSIKIFSADRRRAGSQRTCAAPAWRLAPPVHRQAWHARRTGRLRPSVSPTVREG
jgi:hypothetical protein